MDGIYKEYYKGEIMNITVKKNKSYNFNDLIMFIYMGTFIFARIIDKNIYRILGIFFIVYFLFQIIIKGKLVFNSAVIWQILFIISNISSLLYADIIKSGILYTIISTATFIFFISQYFCDEKDNVYSIESVLKYMTFWGICFMLYILLTQSQYFQYGRLGSRGLSDKFENAIGFSYYTIIITILFIRNALNNKKYKLINYTLVVIAIFISMMSGGRKSVLLPMLFLVIYVILKYKNNAIKVIVMSFITFIIIGIVLIISLEVEFLYDIFGYRLEGLLNSLFGIGQSNIETMNSDIGRKLLILNGIRLFFQKPVFGYGLGMSYELNSLNGIAYLHSHNNFIELLISGGLVMFITYYWIYIYLFKKMFKLIRKDKSDLSIFFIAFLVINLISDIGTISFNLLNFNMFILLASVYVKTQKSLDI